MLKIFFIFFFSLLSSLYAQEPLPIQDLSTSEAPVSVPVDSNQVEGQMPHTELPPPIGVPISLDENVKSETVEFISPEGYSVQTGSLSGIRVKEHTISMVSGEYKPKPGIDPSLRNDLAMGEVEFALIQIEKESLVTEDLFNRIHALGIETYGELPGLVWQAKIPSSAIFELINMPEVRWIGHLPSKLKLHPGMFTLNSQDNVEAIVSLMGDDWVDGQETAVFSIKADAGIDTPENQSSFSAYLTNGEFQEYLESLGLKPILYHRNTRSFRVEGSVEVIASLAKLPSVSFVSPTVDPKLHHDESVPFAGQDYIRDTYDGSGTHVGIIDNEVMMADGAEHDDLNIWGVAWDTTGQGAGANPGGHGTHVAGTILGRGIGDTRFEGNAPGVGNSSTSRFFHGRLFDSAGNYDGPYTVLFSAFASDYTDGSGNVSQRPDIINNSWSSNYAGAEVGTEQEAIDADERVWDGQCYVWSAGNGGTGQTIGSQPSAKNSLTIANANTYESGTPGDNTAGDLRTSSSRGPTGDNRMKPDITAPGAYIISADASTTSGYIANSGTSMSAPHVTGILAGLTQAYPGLEGNPKLMRAWLKATALKVGGSDAPDSQFGFGYINAYRAHYSTADWGLSYYSNPDVKSGGSGNWDSIGLSTDSSVTRLVLIVNWDEPPVTSTGGSTPILADVELRVDWHDDQTGGQAGDVSSTGADNQQFIIVDNPPAGSHRIKVYPVDTRLNGLFPEDLSYSLVIVKEKGNLRPDLTLTSAFVDNTIKLGETGILESTMTVSDYVGTNAMFNVMDNGGLLAVSKTVTLKDGKVLNYDATDPSWQLVTPGGFVSTFSLERMMLGAILQGSRSVAIGFEAPAEGTYYVDTKGNIDNGTSSWGDSSYVYTSLIVDSTVPAEVTSLTSSSHSANVWTSNSMVDYDWTAATDNLSGVDGYGLYTTSSASRPGDFKDIEEVTTYSETLSDGTWYFNISTTDNSGNWSSSHSTFGPIKIDTIAPGSVSSLTSSSHAAGVPSTNPTVDLSWSAAIDTGSGIDGYGIWMAGLAGLPGTTLDIGPVTSYSETLAPGTYYFSIRSVDVAGNWEGSYESFGPIVIATPGPVYSVTPMTAGSLATFTVTGANPSSTVRLGYSLAGPGPFTTVFGVVDMTPPIKTLAVLTSNILGDASFSVTVPAGASGITLYTQGLNNGTLTNSLAEFIN
jgi:serine protease AprX